MHCSATSIRSSAATCRTSAASPSSSSAFLQIRALSRAEVLIVDPDRGNRREFDHRMGQLGFRLVETPLDQPLADGSSCLRRARQYRR